MTDRYWSVENRERTMFHAQDGLFFERHKDTGEVSVIVTSDQQMPRRVASEAFGPINIVFETKLSAETLASVVAEGYEEWRTVVGFLKSNPHPGPAS